MPTLDGLRTQLTEEQRGVLSAIWRHYAERRSWPTQRLVHVQCGGKAAVREALRRLGGSVAFESRDQGREVYQLTVLGVLFTDAGAEIQRLLLRYLDWLGKVALHNPEMTAVESSAVQAALGLSIEETQTLGHLLYMGYFWGGSASHGAEKWAAGLPPDVEDISEDVQTYLEGGVLKDYDAKMPFEEGPRRAYQWKLEPHAVMEEAPIKAGTPPELLLTADMLHPRLSGRVFDLLSRGEHEIAVFEAFREVEVAVREAVGLGPETYGVPLMRRAFDKLQGRLADLSLPEAEREAMSHLFAGAIGLFKNPRSHRHAPVGDRSEAVELVLLANHLLRIVTRQGGGNG
jgi:uncharacterized protein (TIGR02391 family)